jgi:hypothetical protein
MSSSVFDAPPHEPRDVYPTVRAKDGGLTQVEVVEATFLPQPKRAEIQKTIASREFLTVMETKRSCIQKPVGKLIEASLWNRGRANTRAIGMAAPTDYTMRGHYYWIENEPHVQNWWRFSLPWDVHKLSGAKNGKGRIRHEYLRVAMAAKIMQQQFFGPFFVETIYNADDDYRPWFDFYFLEDQDMMMIKMVLG